LTLGVEGKVHAPDLTAPRKPELPHVGVARGLERIDRGPPLVRAEKGRALNLANVYGTIGLVKLTANSQVAVHAEYTDKEEVILSDDFLLST